MIQPKDTDWLNGYKNKTHKTQTDSNTIIVGNFHTSLIPMDRLSKQKINKETQVLNVTLDEMNLIDIFRIFHPNAEEYIFSKVHIEHSPG